MTAVKLINTFIIFLLLPLGLVSQTKREPKWISFEQLSDSLDREPKKTLLFFHTDWCSYCRKMEKEVFTDKSVLEMLDNDYYMVKFDAESIDSVYFDGQFFTNTENPTSTKIKGKHHSLAQILAARNGQFFFPTLILLNEKFEVMNRRFNYLNISQMKRFINNVSQN